MMGFNFALCLSVDRMLFGNIQIKILYVKKKKHNKDEFEIGVIESRHL